jgi:V/A-type H+-transporting ATPase subunit D
VESLTATRTELLARRRAVALAEQGRDVLADKRTALLRAFQARSGELVRRLAALRTSAAGARARLDAATAVVGPSGLASASCAAAARVGVSVQAEVIAGVAVVDLRHAEVRRAPDDRGYAAVATDPVVDTVAEIYEQEVLDLLELAALELTVRRLAHEIARTTQQVNALEQVVVPRLRTQERRIALALEEREREETARLRRARARRG